MKRKVLLDLGFGCADQTLYLMNRAKEETSLSLPDDDDGGGREMIRRPLFDRYIGITIDEKQYEFAQARIRSVKERDENYRQTMNTAIFLADAANPSSWPAELQQCVSATFAGMKDDSVETEPYVLALDTLYHFRPSRSRIFKYANSTLHANFLAFDLFLVTQSQSTLKAALNRLFLRTLTFALSAPFSNLLTPAAYRTQLQEAGYADEDITIEDITDDVFPGLASFLETRHHEITALGLRGFTKWRVSGWLFRRLAAGDLLRAGVVVAKRKKDK